MSERAGRGVVLVVSVDTEEDNWHRARAGITVENVRQLPQLHRLFERLGVRATYFATYQVAIHGPSAGILRDLRDSGLAEIGAHLHPWNTPPLHEPFEPRTSMLSNLPRALQVAKLRTLTDALTAATGERPLAFRAGRWGLGPDTVAALIEQGYRIDSSVTPFLTWEEYHGPSYVGAPLDVYRLDGGRDPRVPAPAGPLLEIPVSSAYSRRPWQVWGGLYRLIARPALRPLRLVGAAARLHLVRHIALSPEGHRAGDMLTLSRRLLEEGVRHLHLFFHSPSLVAGLSPFVTTAAAVEQLHRTVAGYIEALERETAVTFATISEAARVLEPSAAMCA